MLSRVGQDTLRSIFSENALRSPSLGSASHQAKGSRGSAENCKGLGKAREMFTVRGGDWGAPGAERAHTPRSHSCPPECPQQGRKVTKSLTARAELGTPPGSGPNTLIDHKICRGRGEGRGLGMREKGTLSLLKHLFSISKTQSWQGK